MHITFELEVMSFKTGHTFLGIIISHTNVVAELGQFPGIFFCANTLLVFDQLLQMFLC